MELTGYSAWTAAEAERAFGRALRARRRASFADRVLHRCVECARLLIVEAAARAGAPSPRGVRDIPLDAIAGSLEPHRASDFDHEFRPSRRVRDRWLSVWSAEASGAVLPPITVARVDGGYAVRDGHHRVSVARARGAATITAVIA